MAKAATATKTKSKRTTKAKPEAVAPVSELSDAARKRAERDAHRTEMVIEGRNQDPPKSWNQIAMECGTTPGEARRLLRVATVERQDLTPARLVAARDKDNLPWVDVAARFGIPQSRAIHIYEETTGTKASGRPAKVSEKLAKPAKKVKAAAEASKVKSEAKRAAKKGAAAPAGEGFVGAKLEELKTALEGKTMHYTNSAGKTLKVKVKSVNKVGKVGKGDDAERGASYTDLKTGGSHVVPLSAIVKVSK